MRHLRIVPLALLLTGFLALPIDADESSNSAEKSPEVDNASINWLPYDQAMAKLEGEDKHLFVDFTASWCGWCKKMEKTTFSDPSVIETVNEHFIPVKVWGDSDDMLDIEGYKISQKNLAKEYQIRGYPTFWFIAPNGDKIGPLGGYQTTDRLMMALNYVKDYQYDTTRTQQENPAEEEKQ